MFSPSPRHALLLNYRLNRQDASVSHPSGYLVAMHRIHAHAGIRNVTPKFRTLSRIEVPHPNLSHKSVTRFGEQFRVNPNGLFAACVLTGMQSAHACRVGPQCTRFFFITRCYDFIVWSTSRHSFFHSSHLLAPCVSHHTVVALPPELQPSGKNITSTFATAAHEVQSYR